MGWEEWEHDAAPSDHESDNLLNSFIEGAALGAASTEGMSTEGHMNNMLQEHATCTHDLEDLTRRDRWILSRVQGPQP